VTHAVHVGCSGWVYPDWRGKVYPDGLPQRRWLSRYAELFDTVEVNSTFYRLTTQNAVKGWLEQTSDDFVFTVKMSRYVSHLKRLRELDRTVKRFYEPLRPMTRAGRLGPVLWQFPGNFHLDEERLVKALPQLPEGRHAFEFRHPSWFNERVYELLREHQVALVIGDDPKRPFQTHERTAPWTLIRLHHGSRGRKGNYSDKEIVTWARRIGQWRRETEVFVYFNNDWSGYAPANALKLKQSLGA